MTKYAKIPQSLYIDKVVVDMPGVMLRQVPRIQTVLKTMDVPTSQATKHAVFPQIQHIDKVIVVMRVVMQRQVPHIQTSWKIVKVPPAKFVGTVLDVPVIMHIMRINQVTKRVEISWTLFVDKVVDIPVGMVRQVPQL